MTQKARVVFADESAFYLLPSVVKTWAKAGETPVLRPVTARREHLSVASAISMNGELVTKTQEKAFNGPSIVAFLKHLLHTIRGKIILVWDGARIHHCREVKQFLASNKAAYRLRLIRLPAYAPDLNPDEGVWRWLKRRMGNLNNDDLTELKSALRAALSQLRKRPELLQAFFAWAGLPV